MPATTGAAAATAARTTAAAGAAADTATRGVATTINASDAADSVVTLGQFATNAEVTKRTPRASKPTLKTLPVNGTHTNSPGCR